MAADDHAFGANVATAGKSLMIVNSSASTNGYSINALCNIAVYEESTKKHYAQDFPSHFVRYGWHPKGLFNHMQLGKVPL